MTLGLGLLLRGDPCARDLRMDDCAVSELVFAGPPHLRRFDAVAHLGSDDLRPLSVR